MNFIKLESRKSTYKNPVVFLYTNSNLMKEIKADRNQ